MTRDKIGIMTAGAAGMIDLGSGCDTLRSAPRAPPLPGGVGSREPKPLDPPLVTHAYQCTGQKPSWTIGGCGRWPFLGSALQQVDPRSTSCHCSNRGARRSPNHVAAVDQELSLRASRRTRRPCSPSKGDVPSAPVPGTRGSRWESFSMGLVKAMRRSRARPTPRRHRWHEGSIADEGGEAQHAAAVSVVRADRSDGSSK